MMPNSSKKPQPVRVTWQDSRAFSAWHTPEDVEAAELATIETLGFLMYSNKNRTAVAQSLCEDGDVISFIVIPTRATISIEVLDED